MAHSFMIFNFGSNEEAAQQARHKVEGWKQGFRLGNKLMVKFDRGDEKAAENDGKADAVRKDAVLVIVRLDFSDHEKLSHQRWLERIPSEALFRDAHPKILRQGDPEFADAAKRFDALD
jgi:nicotinic acid phosphoribosyltransferase